jgi:hypothetical protein
MLLVATGRFQMKTFKKLMLAVVLAAGASQALAIPVTYNFTGTITNSFTGATAAVAAPAVNSAVSGTFTIDFANGIPSQGFGTVGGASYWTVNSISGSNSGFGTAPQPSVFSLTAQSGGLSFATSSPTSFYNQSHITGNPQGGYNPIWQGFTSTQVSSTSNFENAAITLQSSVQTWAPDGSPVLPAGGSGLGSFQDSSGSGASFSFNSISLAVSPVPLPAAAWLLFSGLAGFGFLGRRRTQAIAGASSTA